MTFRVDMLLWINRQSLIQEGQKRVKQCGKQEKGTGNRRSRKRQLEQLDEHRGVSIPNIPNNVDVAQAQSRTRRIPRGQEPLMGILHPFPKSFTLGNDGIALCEHPEQKTSGTIKGH